MIFRLICTLCLLLSQSQSFAAKERIEVGFSGCVTTEKTIVVEGKLSLFHALNEAQIKPCAYMYGAAWLDPALRQEQNLLKSTLLKELSLLADSTTNPVAQDYFAQLTDIVVSQQPSGRLLNIDLDLFHVEMLPLKNRIITRDAHFYFPSRPKSLHLIGFDKPVAVFNSDLSVNDIVVNNTMCAECQPGWLWIVQPNTQVNKVKVGLWTHESHYAAPGAWLIAAIDESYYSKTAPNLYKHLTQWLSTQVVSQ
jgi:hypothetical protein